MEEMDPVERMRQRYRLDGSTAPAQQRRKAAVPIPSLEEELLKVQRSVNIMDFDYKPVPRTADDED